MGRFSCIIFATSGALEDIAMQRTERNIRSLMELTPDNARLFKEGREMIVPTEQLQISDRVLVKPGEMFPTDGIIQQGFSTVNQAPITGESIPVEKQVTDEVFAGTINGNGALTIELHKPPEICSHPTPKGFHNFISALSFAAFKILSLSPPLTETLKNEGFLQLEHISLSNPLCLETFFKVSLFCTNHSRLG